MLVSCNHIRRKNRLIGIFEIFQNIAEGHKVKHEHRANHDNRENQHQKKLILDKVEHLHNGHGDYVCDKKRQKRAQKHNSYIRKVVADACVRHDSERDVERKHSEQASDEIVQIAINGFCNKNLFAADGKAQQHFVVAVLI